MRFSLRSLLAVMTITAFAPLAPAVDLLTPAGLNPGDTFRFIFVTTGTRDATSRNIADYNAFVQADATGYTYDGQAITWKAIGSTSVNARDNVGGFNTNVPVYLVTGTKVANDLTTNSGGLWSGSISTAVNTKLDGSTTSSNVWTGSLSDGTGSNSLGFYFSPTYGNSSSTGGSWLDQNATSNSNTFAFYGLSADLVVPVPEPSTYALGTIAAGTLAWLARRRKKLAGA